jgi:hypothetical protein
VTVLVDYRGRESRLTDERLEHIERRPEILLVVVNVAVDSPFVVTAFFTDRLQSGTPLDVD